MGYGHGPHDEDLKFSDIILITFFMLFLFTLAPYIAYFSAGISKIIKKEKLNIFSGWDFDLKHLILGGVLIAHLGMVLSLYFPGSEIISMIGTILVIAGIMSVIIG